MNNMKTIKKYFRPDKVTSLILYFSILAFIIAFNFSDNPKSGWYQQFFPDLHGAFITDITFTDSLTGYAVTKRDTGGTTYILKTNNGGDNWNIILTDFRIFTKIFFLNNDTGFACTKYGTPNGRLYKTINGGMNWSIINSPLSEYGDMCVLTENELWISDDLAFDGGLYRTTNGGLNWELKYYNVSHNAEKIYMFNSNFGFMQLYSLYRTTNAGTTWESNSGGEFTKICFIDTLTGWKSYGNMKKTTDGGLSWVIQPIPPIGGIIETSSMETFCIVDKNILWGAGGNLILSGGRRRGLVYKTTNGGNTWGYQFTDTNFYSLGYYFINFTNTLNGWANDINGVHTTNGGNDSTIFVGIIKQETNVTENFKLSQNYPNPFNPKTKIEYELQLSGNINIKVLDLRGKEIITLINKRQTVGKYEIEFEGSELSSGVYFFNMLVDGRLIDTKKMLLIK